MRIKKNKNTLLRQNSTKFVYTQSRVSLILKAYVDGECMGLTVFACLCSAGVAVCITYIILTLLSERKKNAPTVKREKEDVYEYYEAYESGDSLNIDV